MCLVIFLSGNQPASLDMLQIDFITVQREIQEHCHIKEWSLSDKYLTAKKRSLLSQKTYFRCARFIKFGIEQSQLLKSHAKLLLKMTIFNLGKFRAMQLWVWSSKISLTTVVLTESEFQRRFLKYFWFHPLLLPGSQKLGKQ